MAKTKYENGKTSVWGKRKLGGYAGVKHTAKKIIDLIPDITKYNLYVEPFAGLGRTAEYVNIPMVLNDMGKLSNEYCRNKFPNAIVENMDFKETIIKYDNPNTIFVIDPPWRFDTYTETSYTVCDRTVLEYYQQVLNLVENMQGDWLILSSYDEHEQKGILKKSKWKCKEIQSDNKVIFGKYARTLVCSNLFSIRNFKECSICGADYTGMTYEQHEQRPFHQARFS